MIGGRIIQHVAGNRLPYVPSEAERYFDWYTRYYTDSRLELGNAYFAANTARSDW